MIPTLKARRIAEPEAKPVPSVVYPRPFRILPPPDGASGACSADAGLYGAPLDNSPEALSIRAHEYGHLSIHRTQPQLDDLGDKVPAEWYQVGLDCIVNGYCQALGVDVKALPTRSRIPKETPRLTRAIHALQTLSFKTRKTFAGLSEKDVRQVRRAAKALRQMGAQCQSYRSADKDSVITILRNLALYFGKPPIT